MTQVKAVPFPVIKELKFVSLKKISVFIFLLISFLVFSLSIYFMPPSGQRRSVLAGQGRLVWQRYNCQGCHQLYGLGGYLGPDLSNVMSAPNKGEPLVRAFLRAAPPPMPVFRLTEEETEQLIAFLKETDASGSAAPRDFTILPTGMIKKTAR